MTTVPPFNDLVIDVNRRTMVFQSLNIFKSKSEPVLAENEVCLTPQAEQTAGQKGATAVESNAVVQRGTATALKDLANPSQGDIESDFAFISDILSRAGVAETSAPAQAAPTPAAAAAPVQRVSSVPKHVPHHKRGASADKSKPRFAVQDGPRSTKPEFLDGDEAEVTVPTAEAVQTVSPTDIYNSIVGADDDAQMTLPFAGPTTESTPAEAPLVAEPAQTAQVAMAKTEATSEATAPAPEAGAEAVDIEQALAILDMRPSTTSAAPKAEADVSFDAPASAAELAPVRTSMFAKRPKTPKAAKPKQERPAQGVREEHDLDVGIEPPALMRKLMSVLPTAEIPQGVSDFAKARLARDPFDRLMEEAHRA